MRVLLTGGSGDLGRVLCPLLIERGDVPVVIDVNRPSHDVEFVQASIIDREALKAGFKQIDVVVHIAAWHGIHDFKRERDVYEFWDLNVTGTFNVFQASVESGVKNLLFISSTSIDDPYGVYGHTKILGEEIARTYAARHEMNVLTLRPRAFIPSWNRAVYNSYVEWAKWFWSGAVHINDVAQSVILGIDLLSSGIAFKEPLFLTVDGAYEYLDSDLANWDSDGPGSTFKRYYPQYFDLAIEHGLEPSRKPKKLDISETQKVLAYQPKFGLKALLEELSVYGETGPSAPFC